MRLISPPHPLQFQGRGREGKGGEGQGRGEEGREMRNWRGVEVEGGKWSGKEGERRQRESMGKGVPSLPFVTNTTLVIT